VALVSVEDQGTIMALLDEQGDAIRFVELREPYALTQEVLTWVAQYSQPIREVQMVCDHPQQIIDWQRQVTTLQMKQFQPLRCDHSEFERQIQTLTDAWNKARMRPAAPGTDENLSQELANIT
jgi:hypothetical protein